MEEANTISMGCVEDDETNIGAEEKTVASIEWLGIGSGTINYN